MCGIVGYFDKSGAPDRIGAMLLRMLDALSGRGPDSAGVAVWGDTVEGFNVRVALDELTPGLAREAYVGLDPRKDIKWVTHPPDEAIPLLAKGEIDAYWSAPRT